MKRTFRSGLAGHFHQTFLGEPHADFIFDPAPCEIAIECGSLSVDLPFDNVKRLVAFEIRGLVKFDFDLLRQRWPHCEREQQQQCAGKFHAKTVSNLELLQHRQ